MFSAKKLKYLMAKCHLSTLNLASETNIEYSTITRLINGSTTNPRPDTIHSLANYFKVDPSEFYENEITYELSIGNTKLKTTKDILTHLLLKTGILNTTNLHKASGIPKSNLDRIISGDTEKPSLKTLEQLASFFNLTVPQISGFDPIPTYKTVEATHGNKMIPVITFNNISNWLNHKLTDGCEYINTTRKIIGNNSFAVVIDNKHLEPDFSKDSVLIIDSSATPEYGDFIIGEINNKISVLEYHHADNDQIYLRLAGEYELFPMPLNSVNIYGVIIQEIINRKKQFNST